MIDKADLHGVICENLKRLLKARGYSQGELARRLYKGKDSVNERMRVSRWFTGSKMPTMDEVMNIAEALECDIREIISHKNGKKLSKK